MPRPKSIRSQAGPTVKQYGRFHFKRFEVYQDERKIPTNSFVVALDNEDGSYDELGLIDSDKSTLPDLLNHLHEWQHTRYNDIYRLKQVQARAESEEAKVRHQSGLAAWELQYLRVDRAIRELEPAYQPDESIYENQQEPEENKGTCSM